MIHFHSSDPRFCGNKETRQFSTNESRINCPLCKLLDAAREYKAYPEDVESSNARRVTFKRDADRVMIEVGWTRDGSDAGNPIVTIIVKPGSWPWLYPGKIAAPIDPSIAKSISIAYDRANFIACKLGSIAKPD